MAFLLNPAVGRWLLALLLLASAGSSTSAASRGETGTGVRPDHVRFSVPRTFKGNRLLWVGDAALPRQSARGAQAGSDSRAVDLRLRLDRKVYDSLDITAQGMVTVAGGFPDGRRLALAIWREGIRVFHRQIAAAPGVAARVLLFDLRELAVGSHELRVGLVRDEVVLARGVVRFALVPFAHGATRPPSSGSIPILIQPNTVAAGEQILTTGVPLPRGTTLNAEHFKLTDLS